MNKYFLTFILLITSLTITSQKANHSPKDSLSTSWDVSTPALPFKEVTISTDEGTWMSVDISPDGSTLVFDLLGDIYTLPVSGGNATLMPILSFPIVIPLLALLITISKGALGLGDSNLNKDIGVLIAINGILGSVSFILFPYLWRD